MPDKRFVVVVNPRGGKRRGRSVLERVTPVFAAAGVTLDVRVTERAGHGREMARTLDLTGYDALCAVGGDGTVHEVVEGLMQRPEPPRIPLGFIAAGTGNATHQHLGCQDPLEAARRIVAAAPQPLDVARVTMGAAVAYSVNIVGWGAIADINGLADRLRWLGPARYGVAAVARILRPRVRRARLTLDGRTIEDEFLFIIACNTKYTGAGMKLAPHAEIGDGKLDVLVMRPTSRLQMLKMFLRVFDGSHLAFPCVESHQVRSLAIEAVADAPLNLDGENHGTTPVRIELLPGALSVLA